MMTYRTTQWFDAVTASDALPGEGKVAAKQPDEVLNIEYLLNRKIDKSDINIGL